MTREALWQAVKSHRTIGTTGEHIELDYTVNGIHMGGESTDPAKGAVVLGRVKGTSQIDRIELIRDGDKIAAAAFPIVHRHPEQYPLVCTLKLECGWRKKKDMQQWPIDIGLQDGRILELQRLFSVHGSRIESQQPDRARVMLLTRKCNLIDAAPPPKEAIGGVYITIAANSPQSRLSIQCDGQGFDCTAAELFEADRLVYYEKEAVAEIREYTSIPADELWTKGVVYHHARKMKLSRAVLRSDFVKEFEIADPNPVPGTHSYYVRAFQNNGQIAWGSPVWINYKR